MRDILSIPSGRRFPSTALCRGRSALATASLAALCFAVAAADVPAFASRPAAHYQPRANERVGTLPNGLRYFIERGQPGDKVEFRLVVRAGEAEILPREQEVAHVVEHIVSHKLRDIATKGSPAQRVARYGGVPGGDFNAGAGFVQTNYFIRMPANEAAAIAEGFDILRDWATPGEISDEEIDRDRKAVVEEKRRASPSIMHGFETLRRTWYPGEPLYTYHFDPAGTISATAATIRDFHRRWYVPANMALIVVGDIDPDVALGEIRRRFEDIPAGEPVPQRADLRIEAIAGGAFVATASPGGRESDLTVSYKYRRQPAGSPGLVRQAAIARISDMLLAGAFANITQRYGSPLEAGGVSTSFHGNPGSYGGVDVLVAKGKLRPGRVADGLFEILRLLETVRRQGFSVADIEAARARLLGSPPQLRGGPGRWEALFVDGAFEPDEAAIQGEVRALTASEFNDAMKALLDPKARDVVLIRPDHRPELDLSEMDFRSLAAKVARAPAARLSGPVVREPELLAFTAAGGVAPGNGKRAVDGAGEADHGFSRSTLPRSNATLFVRKTAGPIRLHMERRGGEGRFAPADANGLDLASDLVAWSGLGGLDRFEIQRFLASRQISLDASVGGARESLSVSGPAREWSLLLRLARTRILEPQCRADALDDMVAVRSDAFSSAASLTAARADFSNFIARVLGEAELPGGDDVRALKLADACRKERLALGDTEGMTIFVEGDLDEAEMSRSVGAMLDLPASGPKPPLRVREVVEPRPGRHTMRAGEGALASVSLLVHMRADGPPVSDAGFLVADILVERMNHRLRTVERGTYSAGGGFTARNAPYRETLSIGFDCDAANVDRMAAAARDEFRILRENGVTGDELARARRKRAGRGRGLAELAGDWINRATLAPLPAANDVEVAGWIAENVDPSRIAEFVRLPET
ncbi:M16 family metallopeptidase [Sphingomonas colocasiae]|uniref:Insulinase family protein n=1 Tax=Sphingomonas colocasiae TaxID=1848973 RepID=A0ABS7PS83_9SPHN|nr:insulinase family protein [Sphingomonas colocasiae]MBY8823247.1 insulinase family protein [Sphingomonas colocasiae]